MDLLFIMVEQQLIFTIINEYLPSVRLQNNVNLLPIQLKKLEKCPKKEMLSKRKNKQ